MQRARCIAISERDVENCGFAAGISIEPVFDHLGIFNPATLVWEAILGGLTEIVRNYPKDRFGTKVPFSGTFEHPQPDIFATIGNAFRNAFVQAFSGKLENWKKLPPVKPEEKQ